MTNQILYGIAVVPAIVGLVQVAKDMGLPSRFAPALSVGFGLLAGVAEVFGAAWPVTQAVVVGIALGLSASGLYSGAGAIVSALATGSGSSVGPAPTHLQDVSPSSKGPVTPPAAMLVPAAGGESPTQPPDATPA